MEKITIIGGPGAGKTTLAQKMHPLLGVKVIHLDRIFWERGWQARSRDERIDILQERIGEKQWIIEGAYIDLSEPRLDAADIIIFLDTHLFMCLCRLIKRHCEDRKRSRRDIPLECTDKLTILRLWKALVFPFRERRWLKKNLLHEFSSKKIIWLDSEKKVNTFLAQLEQYVYEERQPAQILCALEQGSEYFSRPFSLLSNRSIRYIQQIIRERSTCLWNRWARVVKRMSEWIIQSHHKLAYRLHRFKNRYETTLPSSIPVDSNAHL